MRKLDFRRKVFLSAVALTAVGVQIVLGQENATQIQAESTAENPALIAPVFEVASIKPSKSGSNRDTGVNRYDFSRFTVSNFPLDRLIPMAFGVPDNRISGIPKWAQTAKYDIDAKTDSSLPDELQRFSPEQRRRVIQHMIQALLEDRFQLKFHRETKDGSLYALVISKNGPKLQESKSGEPVKGPDGLPVKGPDGLTTFVPHHSLLAGNGQIIAKGYTITEVAQILEGVVGRKVVDQTGLKGVYDIALQWTPEDATDLAIEDSQEPANEPLPDFSQTSIFTAVQKQLGLKLIPQKGPIEIIVIDHVERPSTN